MCGRWGKKKFHSYKQHMLTQDGTSPFPPYKGVCGDKEWYGIGLMVGFGLGGPQLHVHVLPITCIVEQIKH